jgi:hypothetical protein
LSSRVNNLSGAVNAGIICQFQSLLAAARTKRRGRLRRNGCSGSEEGMADLLGSGRRRGGFRPFEEARAFARKLGITTQSEWNAYCKSGKKPDDIPTNPQRTYRTDWIGTADWLGTKPHRRVKGWRPFEDARAFVRALGLGSENEWRAYCKSGKKPDDIPTNPQTIYRTDWISTADWLGTKPYRPVNGLRPFKDARAFVRALGLRSTNEWRAYCKSGNKPSDIPTSPGQVYRADWIGMSDWIGTKPPRPVNGWRPFEDARAFVRGLGLLSQRYWHAYCKSGKKPNDIPANSPRIYADLGWISWGDWLGFPAKRGMPSTRAELLAALQSLYEAHGIKALATPFLEQECLYARLLAVGLKQPVYLEALGLTQEYAVWREETRTYGGRPRPRWTWELVVAEARTVKDRTGELPSMDWFRKNGQSSLVNTVFKSGHSWCDLRKALGSFTGSSFRQSRSGMRWRSQPETSMSDFLFARGIKHKRGERYDQGYAEQSGRRHGTYDMHFLASDGRWIDVEIWGDLPDNLSGGRYARTRALKEKWNSGNPNFLGLQYTDCLSDEKLTRILKPFIGVIEPFNFEKPQDPFIETSHWTDADELVETCRQLAAQQPDGVLPNEQWMRKRGRYADREGPVYNTLAVRINQWLGGIRRAREFLGQADHSTEDWTPEKAIAAWREFEEQHGVTPTQAVGRLHHDHLPWEVIRWAQAIRGACVRYGVLDEARKGRSARRIKWTRETLAAAWAEFNEKYGVPVNLSVGKSGSKYPRSQLNEASRIYSAALRLGLVDWLKGKNK